MPILIDPDDPELRDKINSLTPTLGYCFFIDMVGSTALKDEQLPRWIIYIYNTFANIRSFLSVNFRPIKCLGDELMFFIPETGMGGETPLTLYDCLIKILFSDESYFRPVKIGAAFCREAYEITFFSDYPDIYGKDIDLTARLTSEAGPQELIMNSEFVERVQRSYAQTGNHLQFPDVPRIEGPIPKRFRGFVDEVEVYITRRNT